MLFMDSCTKIAIFFIKSKQFIAKGEISKKLLGIFMFEVT